VGVVSIVSGYCSSTESQAWIADGKTFTQTQLLKIDVAVEAASRMIDEYCKREPGAFIADTASTARVFTPVSFAQVYTDDISSSSITVAVDTTGTGVYDQSWTSSDYQLEPVNAIAKGRPINQLRAVGAKFFPIFDYASPWVTIGANRTFYAPGAVAPAINRVGQATVQVTAAWGWPAVPTPIKQATIIQSTMLYQAQDAPAGLAGTPDMGQLRYPTGLHPSAVLLVQPYVQNAGGLIP
jgi:hypothetical protein